MMPKEIVNYRKLIVLNQGKTKEGRDFTDADQDEMIQLFTRASDGDVRYLRDDVKNVEIIKNWCTDINYTKVLPILAIAQNSLMGLASLHFHHGPERHIGEVRIYLAKEYRRRGLGTQLLKALIELAHKYGLYFLQGDAVTSQTKVIKALQNLGFKRCCTFDYFGSINML